MKLLPVLFTDAERFRRKEFSDAESELLEGGGIHNIPTSKNILLIVLNPLSVGSISPMELLVTLHNLHLVIDAKLIASGKFYAA